MCAVTTFSLTRRHDAARALSRYVQGEVRGGRSLGDVLDDEDVRAAVTDSPEVLEDVTDDRELREALRPAVPSCTLVIGYDASPAARAAIEHAARLMPAANAIVVTAWERVRDGAVLRTAAGLPALPALRHELEAEAKEACAHAQRTAEEGAALARAHGLEADALASCRGDDAWDVLVELAAQFEADLVVIGTRARSCARALVGGSVAHRAISEHRVPVLIVPAGTPVAPTPAESPLSATT